MTAPACRRRLAGRQMTASIAFVASTFSACRSPSASPIQLIVGSRAEQHLSFAPEAAFAEYVEVPGSSSELHLTLAGYAASCDRFVSPGPKQALVAVVKT